MGLFSHYASYSIANSNYSIYDIPELFASNTTEVVGIVAHHSYEYATTIKAFVENGSTIALQTIEFNDVLYVSTYENFKKYHNSITKKRFQKSLKKCNSAFVLAILPYHGEGINVYIDSPKSLDHFKREVKLMELAK